MRKLCLDVFSGIGDSLLYPLMRKSGFDGFFSPPDIAHDLPVLQRLHTAAEKLGLFQETVHSTIENCWMLWREGLEGDRYVKTLLGNIDHCVRIGVPLLVVHPQTNLMSGADAALGLRRLVPVVDYAKKAGIRLAVENVDSAELLEAVLTRFPEDHVGFCYDSGHETWLTPDARYLRRYGDRLFCTHLNDNDGTGDRHWLPGDGKADFSRICDDLRACGYAGPLSLEVAYRDRYRAVCTEGEFIARCFAVLSELRSRVDG